MQGLTRMLSKTPPNDLEAVLLDFDCTLADLGDFVLWEDARRKLLPLYQSRGVPRSFLEAHMGALSLYRDVAAAQLLPEVHLREVQQQASHLLDAFEAEAAPRTTLLPMAREFVARLPRLRLRSGIVTSNAADVVLGVLERQGVETVFGAIVGRGDVLRLKPSPEGLFRCCEQLGVAPERCIYVGDSASDMEAARAAGMRGFGVRGGMSSEAELASAGAETVADDLVTLAGPENSDRLGTARP